MMEQEKTSMLHQEILVRPTEADVKEIFTALKMGMMGETASHELKMMMEQLLQASKAHLPAEPSQNALNSNGPKAQAKPAVRFRSWIITVSASRVLGHRKGRITCPCV
jgi:hypothetical protein